MLVREAGLAGAVARASTLIFSSMCGSSYIHPRAHFLAIVEWRTLLEYFIYSGAI